jgi:hypothetical protein
VFDEIRKLLAAPRSGTDAPPLERVEHTLTTGYAHALALEAERWRIERRLSEVAAGLREERIEPGTIELVSLAKRLKDADGELSRLRTLLETLRTRASDLRGAQARACQADA